MTSESMGDAAYSGRRELELLERATNYNRRLVDLICSVESPERRVVDFGAGMGTLALAVVARGYDVTCIEPDAGLRSALTARGLRPLDSIEELENASVAFIYSINVLEHIENDAAALAALYRKLRSGGRLLLYVPAFPLLYSQMDRNVGHVRRYTKTQLIERAHACGFQVEHAAYADSVGFLASLMFRGLGSRGFSETSLRLYDRFVFPLSRALDRLGLARVVGKNLVVVLRRPTRPSLQATKL